jgi:hypothetical protein
MVPGYEAAVAPEVPAFAGTTEEAGTTGEAGTTESDEG